MRVIDVKYIREYIVEVYFYDGAVKQVDLKPFLFSGRYPLTKKYKKIELFKQVKVEHGHLSWGKHAEMALSGESLYDWKD